MMGVDSIKTANAKMVTKLLFRLLPVQILLAAVGAVNGIVSSFFASNFVGTDGMSAVGLYGPLNMLVTSVGAILVGGSVILCGKYMGQNRQNRMHNFFSLNLVLTFLIAAAFTVIFLTMGLTGLTGFFTKDESVRPLFNSYLIGQSIGILPQMLGSSFSAFLSLENKGKRSLTASIIYIAVNILLNFVFVKQLRLEAFGLALASALGMWVFMLVQAQFYVSGKSHLRFSTKKLDWKESREIFHIGLPGALSNIYQTARGLIVNGLLGSFVGSAGISAFAAANNLLGIVWAIPVGMLAVSRMMISVSVGEEDRRTLTDIMRVMFRRFIPLMCAVCAAIILAAVPLTRIFFRDPAEPVYMMTAWGLRILPLCMTLSIICMHFNCYGEASGKHGLVHLLSVLDGVVCVAGFTALLIRPIGMNSVYIANVLNGVVTTLVIVGYACLRNKHFPHDMEQLMVIPDAFGVAESERMDMSVGSMEEVVRISEQVQKFCLERGVDERQQLAEGEDITKNIGIRMVFRIARNVKYQNILGMNVLTIRI